MNTRKLTIAVCSYNRAERLPALIKSLLTLPSPVPFEVLIVNNNSSDNTLEVLEDLKQKLSAHNLRFVTENKQGISYARNRALEECINTDYMFVMDDDELPRPGILNALYQSLHEDNMDCVGGKVDVKFSGNKKPSWLKDELLGFLAETDYGDDPFIIKDNNTPIWTANIAYRMKIFRENPELRFDLRYNRMGKDVGGGEDVMMFNEWVERGYKLAYNPMMVVEHHVEKWRLKQSYFYKLHFTAGKKKGLFETKEYENSIYGVPPFLLKQALFQSAKTVKMFLSNHPNKVRQGMNNCHAFGLIYGYFKKNNACAKKS